MNYSATPTVDHPKRRTKSGTLRRHKSIVCDGDFVNDLKANGFFAPLVPDVSRVVVHLLPVSLPCSLTEADTHSLPETLDAKHEHKKRRARKSGSLSRHGEELLALFFHKALENEPNVKPFTLMLSVPVERLMRAKGKHALAWLHKRVVRQLRPLGEHYRGGAVPFWLAIQESPAGRLHGHGEISLGHVSAERRTVRQLRRVFAPLRKALKAAGGKWDAERDGDGTQLRFSRGRPDFRWAGYCVRDAHKSRAERRRFMRQFGLSDRRWVAGFEGKSVTASSGLRRKAIAAHAAAVDELARCGASSPVPH